MDAQPVIQRPTARMPMALLSALLLLGPAACRSGGQAPAAGTGPSLSAAEMAAGREWQQALLDKGALSRADVESAADRVGKCLAPFGVETRDEGWDPVSQQRIRLFFRNQQFSPESLGRITDECQQAYFIPVAQAYQKQTPARLTPPLWSAVSGCLVTNGVETAGLTADPAALVAAVPQSQQPALKSCVTDSVHELYPEVSLVQFP